MLNNLDRMDWDKIEELCDKDAQRPKELANFQERENESESYLEME